VKKNEYKGYAIMIFHGEWKINDKGCVGMYFIQHNDDNYVSSADDDESNGE
jgi:hypothetical protein